MKLSVLQLNTLLKRMIDNETMLSGIALYGEVSGFKISGGNAYFDLKEEGAAISCMMFGSDVVELASGTQVELFGRLSFYPKIGKLTFIAKRAQALGKGALFEQYLKLKERLENEGIFDAKTKKEIPRFAKKIGLVTSETGAVLHDMMTIARKKNPKVDFVLFPVKVQGTGAEETIAHAIEHFSTSDVDLVIVARGGGSFEDLAPFNTEVVARAIFACNKPLISAVGHETDVSISDFAADLRCATPSVASETAVFDWFLTKKMLSLLTLRARDALDTQLEGAVDLLKDHAKRAFDAVDVRLCDLKRKLHNLLQQNTTHIEDSLKEASAMLDILTIKIEKDNPLALLRRGYVLTEGPHQRKTSISQIEENEIITLRYYDGTATAKILHKERNNDI